MPKVRPDTTKAAKKETSASKDKRKSSTIVVKSLDAVKEVKTSRTKPQAKDLPISQPPRQIIEQKNLPKPNSTKRIRDEGAAVGEKAIKKPKITTIPNDPPIVEAPSSPPDAEENITEDEHLAGFSTDEDSSDDDGAPEVPGIDIAKLPTIARDDATVQRRLEKAKKKPTVDRGVLYLGRIPHGFYEDQMKAYFSQFGDVTRLRLSRSKKTGRSKHYAFIEFDSSSVAEIVSETMDNYLLMGHLLQCKVIPKDQVHPELWIGANRKWRKVPMDRLQRVQQNKKRTQEERDRAERKLLKRQEEKKRKIAEAGINYQFDSVAYANRPHSRHPSES